MIADIEKLKARSLEIEWRLPLLLYKGQDEIAQIRRFILIYYKPVLSRMDID